jgi:hypothetical protein
MFYVPVSDSVNLCTFNIKMMLLMRHRNNKVRDPQNINLIIFYFILGSSETEILW